MPEEVSTRKAIAIDSDVYAEHQSCDRWAVIVGISRYKNSGLDLQYADRDADELYKLLQTPQGGRFEKDYIFKLTNKQATKRNINRALRSFLKKPAREDVVLLYFACHGSPDPERPGNVYLLTHDTDPTDIAGTALPMGDIDRALRDTLLSEKVIILADTCHSAAIGSGIRTRAVTENTTLINRYLKDMSQARGGTALLTSAEANEVSFEDKRWGGGHGVFTYYLLQGLRGEADVNKNGFVSVGELFEYVRENVKKATNHRQHPSIGTNPFDRNMPLSIASSHTAANPGRDNSASKTSVSHLLGSGLLPTLSRKNGRLRFRKRYAAIALAALGLLAGREAWLPKMKEIPAVVFGPNTPSVPIPATLTTAQILREAKKLETSAIAQLQEVQNSEYERVEEKTQGFDNVILTLEKAKSMLLNVSQSSPEYEQAQKAREIYESRQQYAEALKLGWISAVLAGSANSTTSPDVWDKIIEAWEEAIARLKEIPITEPQIYSRAQETISSYERNLSKNRGHRLAAPYNYALGQGNYAEQEREKAALKPIQSSKDWNAVAGLWEEAVEQMAKITRDDSRYEKAKQKIDDYTKNAIYARDRSDLLSEAGL